MVGHAMTSTGRPRPFVLVADDDRDTRELYRAFFDTSGYRTAEAGSGLQAMRSALEIVPDVLLTDYAMPDVDGVTLARRLRDDPRTAAVRILMVTGYATPALERRAIGAGIDRVLAKPCLPQAVMKEVARALARPPYRKPERSHPIGSPSGAALAPAVERRNSASRRAALERVRHEFAALPGLALTPEQARLIFGLNRDATERILLTLVSEGFLSRTSQGAFRRPR
jgi:two-component system, cell cycle response regulator DivK